MNGPNKLECNIVLELKDLSVANTLAYSYNENEVLWIPRQTLPLQRTL